MKLFFITFTFVILFMTFNSEAQLMNPYKAKDGIEDARSWLKNNGMTDPRLILAATSSQEVEFAGTKIKIVFDFETGKSQAWIYIFRDESDTTNTKGVAVIKTFLGAQVVDIPFQNLLPGNLNIDLNLSIEKYAFFDSDAASQKFKDFKDFADFYNKTKPQDMITMALFLSQDIGSGSFDIQPYWGVIMVKNGAQKLCASNALNGVIFCTPEIIDGINDNNNENIKSYPNPAEEYLKIENIPLSDKYEVYDMFGRKNDVQYSTEGNSVRLSIGGLSSGVYYLRTSNNSILFVKN